MCAHATSSATVPPPSPPALPLTVGCHAAIAHLLEGREQLDADEAHLVAPDVFEQEGVVLQVVVRQVVLYLGHQLLDQLLVRGLPAVLLQLPAARARPAGCACVGKGLWLHYIVLTAHRGATARPPAKTPPHQ